MRQLSPLDATFLFLESPRTPMHIGSVAIYDPSTIPDGKLDFRRLRDAIAARLHRARAMRERLVQVPLSVDYPYWVQDPDFELDYHIRHTALPPPGDMEQLWQLAAYLFARPLDLTKPLWEMYVVERLDAVPGLPQGSYAIIGKVHHAAVDGLSGIEVMAVSHDLAPDAAPETAITRWQPEAMPRRRDLLVRAGLNAVRNPIRAARTGLKMAAGLRTRVGSVVGASSAPGPAMAVFAPRTRFAGEITPHRVFRGVRFPFARIKAIKDAHGLKVNDVVLAICAGALRRYLLHHHDLPDRPLLAMVPVSVRGEGETGGNRVVAMSVPLATDVEDPAERLTTANRAQSHRKQLLHAVGARELQELSAGAPAALLAMASRLYGEWHGANLMAPVFNTVVTNVPGPRVPLYNAGAKMVAMYGQLPIVDNMGLGHVVNSYLTDLTISFIADRAMMPDPAFYADCLERSFEELSALA